MKASNNSPNNSQFDQLQSVFRDRQNELPKQVKYKLYFIASLINKRPFNSSANYNEHSEEARHLTQLDETSLIIIFNTLVSTLLPEKKAEERKCSIKFNGYFEYWKESKVVVNQKRLVFLTDKYSHKFNLAHLRIGNQRKIKKVFDLFLKDKMMVSVKFVSVDSYQDFVNYLEARMQELLQGKDKKSLCFQKMEEEEPEAKECVFSPMKENSSERNGRAASFFQPEDIAIIQDEIKKQRLEGYHVVERADNICIYESDIEPRIHVNLMVKASTDLAKVVNYYLHQQQWCSEVAAEYITEEAENVFEIFRVFKNESIFEMHRGTLTQATVSISKNMAQMIEETKDSGKKDNKLVCHVSSKARFYRCLGGIKIIIDCSFDGKGYFDTKDSCEFVNRWFKELKFFGNNFKLSELQNNFNMLVKQADRVVEVEKSPSSSKGPSSSKHLNGFRKIISTSSDNIGTADTLENQMPKDQSGRMEPLFFRLKPKKPTCLLAVDYIKLVTSNEHCRSYLKQRFDQSVAKKYDSYLPSYTVAELIRKKEFRVNDSKELIYMNHAVMQEQKGSLMFVMKQVGGNIISGKSILDVSLPVDIFESRSLLERSASSFGMVPDYLLPIADADPLTQMKSIIALFATIPTLELVMLKPFNPILGQTFQTSIKGIPIYYEQISHHPPISSFYMACPEFTMHGNLVVFGDLSLNSAVGGNEGITYIKMRNGSEFQCYFAPCQISGLVFGDRKFSPYGKGYILEKKSKLLAEVSIEDTKKGLYEKGNQKLYHGSIVGGIFKIKAETIEDIIKQKSLKKYSGLKVKDVVQKKADIRGTWFQDIKINNQMMTNDIKVYPLEYPKVALPSDANYRLDVLHHKIGDIPHSQHEKEVLEIRQRTDRKLREKGAKMAKRKK